MTITVPASFTESAMFDFLSQLCREHGCFWRPGRSAASFVVRDTGEAVFDNETVRILDGFMRTASDALGAQMQEVLVRVAQEFGVSLAPGWMTDATAVSDSHLAAESRCFLPPASMEPSDLVAFWASLLESGVALHPDDSAYDVVQNDSGAPFFSRHEADSIEAIVDSAFEVHGHRVYDFASLAWRRAGTAPRVTIF